MFYTFSLNGLDGLIVENNPEDVINYLDTEKIKVDIEKAKEDKADLIIVYPHWGVEYQSYPSVEDVNLARNMVDWWSRSCKCKSSSCRSIC